MGLGTSPREGSPRWAALHVVWEVEPQVQPWFLMDGRARTPGRTQNLSTYANAPRDEPPSKSASRGVSVVLTGK